MKRWIFNVLCLLSFLLCICFLFLWVWTQSHEFSLRRHINSQKQKFLRETDIKLVAGQLLYADWTVSGSGFIEPSGIYETPQWRRPTPVPKPYSSWDYDVRSLSYPGGKGYQFLGLRYDRSVNTRDQSFALHIPFSWLTLLSAILPAIWLFRHRRQRQPNTCQNCGYDLRATPTRCPECGATPQPPRETLPLPPGDSFWKPLTIALFITILLIFLLEWIISPPPLYVKVYSSFAIVWTLSAFVGVGLAVILRPAAGGRAITVSSFVLLLLSLLFFAVPFIELYEPSHHHVNSYSGRGFIHIYSRTDTDFSILDCRDIRGRVCWGFGAYSCTSSAHSEKLLIFHIWPIALLCAILPASWLSRVIRSRVRSSRAAELQSA